MLTKDLIFIGITLFGVAGWLCCQHVRSVLHKTKEALSASVSKNVELISELEKRKSDSEVGKIAFGMISRPNPSDWGKITSAPEALEAVMKVLTYEAMRRTDVIRDENASEKIQYRAGGANAAHEILFMFYKTKIESQKKEKENEEAE